MWLVITFKEFSPASVFVNILISQHAPFMSRALLKVRGDGFSTSRQNERCRLLVCRGA